MIEIGEMKSREKKDWKKIKIKRAVVVTLGTISSDLSYI